MTGEFIAKHILPVLGDYVRYMPLNYDERGEIDSVLRQMDNIIWKAWERLKKDDPALGKLGLVPYIELRKKQK